jgi:Sec-independent protein secretion pathway component TatC
MSLQLERDSKTHVQSHLDELTGRVTLIFAVIVGLTFLISTQIDQWLDLLLSQIDPCSEACMNLYDPAKWSAVRWLSATLAAIIVTGPLILQQVWAFSHKGLLPKERSWMVRWMLGGGVIALTVTMFTLGYGLPLLFDLGHGVQTDMGLVAQYDAVLMLSIALAVVWTQSVVGLAILGMVLAGSIGALNENTADWWRIRCYGLVLLLMYASLPEFGGLAFVLIVGSILTIETVCRPWLQQPATGSLNTLTVMDEEGGARRPIVLQCLCSGAALPLPTPLDTSIPVLSYTGLCVSQYEREMAYTSLMEHASTDAFITGCSSAPIGENFRRNCRSIGVNLSGMDLLERQSYRTQPSRHAGIEFEIMLAQIGTPWPKKGELARILKILNRHPEETYVYKSGPSEMSWGTQLKPNEILIHVDEAYIDEFRSMVELTTLNVRKLVSP